MNESRERIRREREREKNTYTSPRLALRRVLLLAEGRQFREAAAILARLGSGVLQSVASELPIDLLVEALPHSAHLIETLLNRLICLDISPRPDIQCDAVAWRLVGLLGADQGTGLRARTARLASALVHYTPDSRDTIDSRRRQLDAAVQECDAVAWRLVGLLGADQGTGLRARTARLATALVHYTPESRDTIDSRRRQLDAAVQECDAVAWRLVGLLGADQGTGLRARTARWSITRLTPGTRSTVDADSWTLQYKNVTRWRGGSSVYSEQTRALGSGPGQRGWPVRWSITRLTPGTRSTVDADSWTLQYKVSSIVARMRCGGVAARRSTRSRPGHRAPGQDSALVYYTPDSRDTIDSRRRQLDAAVQGLGTHGLTADSTGTLISLHVAMKNELQRHVESPVTINQDPASSSHQRLLALSHADVERRLIDNKSLLTIVDKPALRQLPTLVSSLAARVESDKAVLACVGQIKRSDPTLDLSDTRPVAGVLMSYSRGCAAVLSLMTEGEGTGPDAVTPRSPTDSASDGYHSDSDDSQHPDRAADEALPALAALEPLRQTPHLKYKIIFSVVVVRTS
ncbi:Uncharacterized protein OBRU01_15281 [Operophtera brumata]|uniref:Uncharacterized protein n=1 Tax=Operophtera brumata TaxID=104452 RepID=A0A0L7L4Q0_OPEBR|nr:Uncharacterized protein OBRU01_15281 [Operophtera brumata]